jgi:hypothetical protein
MATAIDGSRGLAMRPATFDRITLTAAHLLSLIYSR